MSTSDIDLASQAQSRVAGLLTRSARFRAYVAAVVAGLVELKNALRSIDNTLDIDFQRDASPDVNLDVIGRIVGQPRRLLGAVPRSFFGFKITSSGDFQNPLSYGDRADSTRGGPMWNRGGATASSSLATDADYRFMLKARIVKNHLRLNGSESWLDKVYDVLLLIFPLANSGAHGVITHVYPLWAYLSGMVLEIGIGKIPSAREAALLTQADLVPVPLGCGMRTVCWDDSKPVFGFAGQQCNVASYGDRAHPDQGGVFAERVTGNVPI